LRKDYIETGKVQWVVVNASDDESEQYGKIFALARCAHRQGKYWDLLDGLFSVAHRAPSVLEELVAKSPLINRAELEICLRDRSVRTAVTKDFVDAARLKIRGTPTFVVSKWSAGGQRTEVTIAGAQSLEYFRRALDDLLKKP
jgi:protein-disulfide isomerase